MLFRPSGKGRKRQKRGEKGRFRPISWKGGQAPLKPPFVTPPFAAAQLSYGHEGSNCSGSSSRQSRFFSARISIGDLVLGREIWGWDWGPNSTNQSKESEGLKSTKNLRHK